MISYDEIVPLFKEALGNAQKIVILQADNPDGDSLSSTLALELLIGNMGKDVVMYCAIDVPEHLRYLEGWDRIQKEMPSRFDLAIIVDCGFWRLFGHLEKRSGRGSLPAHKVIVFDEHDLKHDIEALVDIHDEQSVSSGQIIFEVFSRLGAKIDKPIATFIASSILSDTLGFNSEVMLGRPRPFEIMASLVASGLDMAELQDKRFEQLKISADTLRYKGELLQRVEFSPDGRIAMITIPYDEIREHSQEFNPTVILDETRMVHGVAVTIGFKQYVSRGRLVRVTGRIRCNRGYSIADALAKTFPDGGGHSYASGFKVEGDDIDFDQLKAKTIAEATRLLDTI